MEHLFFHILGMSSSQLTFHIFQRGWNHQPDGSSKMFFFERFFCWCWRLFLVCCEFGGDFSGLNVGLLLEIIVGDCCSLDIERQERIECWLLRILRSFNRQLFQDPIPYAPCMEYSPTKLGDFWANVGTIFQHHGPMGMKYEASPRSLNTPNKSLVESIASGWSGWDTPRWHGWSMVHGYWGSAKWNLSQKWQFSSNPTSHHGEFH